MCRQICTSAARQALASLHHVVLHASSRQHAGLKPSRRGHAVIKLMGSFSASTVVCAFLWMRERTSQVVSSWSCVVAVGDVVDVAGVVGKRLIAKALSML